MVKPAGPYLDVIRQVRDAVHVPVVAYQVSGEFSLIKAAAAARLDRRARGGARDPDRHPARRRGSDHHLLRAGDGAVAERMSVRRPRAAVPRRLPAAAGAAHARSGSCARPGATCRSTAQLRAKVDFETLHAHARAGRRGDPAAAAALRARCRHPLQRHHDPAAGHGRGRSTSSRARSCASPSAPTRRSMRCRRWCPSATCRSCSRPSAWCAPSVPRGAPLIGFAGGPFTLLCYLVCGKPSKEFGAGALVPLCAAATSAERLLGQLADAMAAYLRAQAARRRPGADAVRVVGGAAGAARVRRASRCAAVRRTMAALRAHRRAAHLLRRIRARR